ncbi:MAG: SDR family NAD(P)-dependent oxidoreductase [Eggerthellaceae bacterium]|jgi:NAD(P)-dependent dehydrogenase (short-subunit alcohol dehydrogenase family)
MTQRVWFITGASRGMGACFAQCALDAGDAVVATARSPKKIGGTFGPSDNLLPVALDVTDSESIAHAVSAALDHFGRIDILLNNAGYGIFGALEETSDAETRAIYDTNVFGTMNVIRAVLPTMRAQHTGRIVTIASMAGYATDPGGALYDTTKFALVGLTEVLAQELAPFGIEAMAVCPGMIRTGFFGAQSMKTPEHLMEAYSGTPARGALEYCQSHDGRQYGDPEKVARLVYEVSTATEPMPTWLPVGKDAMKKLFEKCDCMKQVVEPYYERACATSYPRPSTKGPDHD